MFFNVFSWVFFFLQMFCSQCKNILWLMNRRSAQCIVAFPALELQCFTAQVLLVTLCWHHCDTPTQPHTHTASHTRVAPPTFTPPLRGSFHLDLPWANSRDTVITQRRRLPVLGRRTLSSPVNIAFPRNARFRSGEGAESHGDEERKERGPKWS